MLTKIMECLCAILLAACLILGVGYHFEHEKVKSLEQAQMILMANKAADDVHTAGVAKVQAIKSKHHEEVQAVTKEAPDWSATPLPPAAACLLQKGGCKAPNAVPAGH